MCPVLYYVQNLQYLPYYIYTWKLDYLMYMAYVHIYKMATVLYYDSKILINCWVLMSSELWKLNIN